MDRPAARYDGVADLYDAMFGDSVEDPATAALLDLVGEVAGGRVLDVPCGSGRVARELARRGASVTGADVSAALLERALAAEATNPRGVEYLHADATSAGFLQGRAFDVVVCSYGLSDIDDLGTFLTTVARLLRPSGTFAFSILHPCFPGIPGLASPSWPPGGYHDERWWQADCPASDLRRQVGSNHRTLSTYVNRLLSAGLTLEALAEPHLDRDLGGMVADAYVPRSTLPKVLVSPEEGAGCPSLRARSPVRTLLQLVRIALTQECSAGRYRAVGPQVI